MYLPENGHPATGLVRSVLKDSSDADASAFLDSDGHYSDNSVRASASPDPVDDGAWHMVRVALCWPIPCPGLCKHANAGTDPRRITLTAQTLLRGAPRAHLSSRALWPALGSGAPDSQSSIEATQHWNQAAHGAARRCCNRHLWTRLAQQAGL